MAQGRIRIAALTAVAACVAAVGWAAVGSRPVTVSVKPGFYFAIPFELTADEAVAGINGELSFDPAKFENPEVVPAAGALGFTVVGHSPEPGKLRFVVYSDPIAMLQPGPPLFFIRLQARNIVPAQPTETLSYSIAAAGSPAGVSLGGVAFENVTVVLQQSSASDWAIYE